MAKIEAFLHQEQEVTGQAQFFRTFIPKYFCCWGLHESKAAHKSNGPKQYDVARD